MTDDNFKGSRRDGYTPTTLADVMARVRKGYTLTNAEAGRLCDAIERVRSMDRYSVMPDKKFTWDYVQYPEGRFMDAEAVLEALEDE